ncbi:HAD-IA family hydrolase [Kribbella kalugense]|uniref:HAD superfamily hydrolase (TIGR01509 family) n=1 Tax=Kribbella kalugense TaxID=2512221 RepID=A0A4R7ZE04_9ACTN|nr:HAD-IA family hydrolase [Kribbella kalugense]TDW15462.1 HAD superfamily hydrolase (TIGR01509 family) [Kribbella kalugense]
MNALIFDCDGVLGDTERDGHLPAFNATFDHFGLPVRWSVEEYGRLLKIGGGKERLATVLDDPEVFKAAGSPSADERADVIASWHKYKTKAFTDLIAAGVVPPRPGVRRIITEALRSGWTVAVASTSAIASVRAVLVGAVGAELAARIPIFAGDVVPRKKPDPAVYELALHQLALVPDHTLVIEDSSNGLQAATGAGLATVVTVSGYTRDEDFTGAALVVSSLGDPDGEQLEVLADPWNISPVGALTLDEFARLTGHKEGGHE